MAVGNGTDLFAQTRHPRGGIYDLGRDLTQLVEPRLRLIQLVALMVGAARDVEHRRRDLARRRRQLLTDRREIARGRRDSVGRAHDLHDDAAEPLTHAPHRVRQHLELARHLSRRHGAQIAAAETLGGRHEPDEGPFDPAQCEHADHHADDRRRHQHEPQRDLALARESSQALARARRLLRLPRGQLAGQPIQLAHGSADRAREGLCLARPAEIEQRMGQ